MHQTRLLRLFANRSTEQLVFKRIDSSVNKLSYRRLPTTSQTSSRVVASPYPDVDIDAIKNTPLPHYIMNEMKKYDKQTALVDGVTGRELTYGQLETMIARVGSYLVRHQLVTKGTVVTLFSPNCVEYAVIYLAVTSIGGIVSTVNPAYTVHELKHALTLVRSSLLITCQSLLPISKQALLHCPLVKKTIVLGDGDSDCQPFSSLLTDDMSSFPGNIDFNTKEDVACLPFSSGTTGLPKGVMLTHYSILANIIQCRSPDVLNYRPGIECLSAVLPFFHIYGMVIVLLTGLAAGAEIITLPKFEPKSFLDTMQQRKATFLPVVPPIALFLSQHPMVDKYDFSSVSTLMSAAASLGPATADRAKERLRNSNLDIRQGYGCTEASPLTHMHAPNDVKNNTVGTVVPNSEYKIVHIETGEALGPHENGEVCVRGPQLMKGYFNNEKATQETIRDGWLLTGDSGQYDEDGHLTLEARIKEIIKVKGFQVAPAELEELLLSHVAVQDTAVIGQNDERMGELPTAFVVLKPNQKATELELKNFVAERLSTFKHLTGGVIFCKEIPKSASGKILRNILKTELTQKNSTS